MKKSFLVAFLFILNLSVFGQGEASNWFFGNRAGIRFNNDGTITTLSVPGNSIAINTTEGCSSMSDPAGNLMLYTDGRTVWDRNHLPMPNGNFSLLGDPSSTQSGIIVPNPSNRDIYYVFTVDEPHQENARVYPNQFTGNYSGGGSVPADDDGFNNGLNYSVIDFSILGANGSIGDVTSRNIHLVTYDQSLFGEEIKYKCSEKITAVKNRAGNGYWVVAHFTDKFYAFQIDNSGVNTTPVVSNLAPFIPISGYRRNAIGQIKISPDGKKIAIAHQQMATVEGATTNDGTVYIYDFDTATGIVSNGIELANNFNPYGIEFSPRAKNLYFTSNAGLHQINIENLSDPISVTMLEFGNVGGSLQLGPNGKIYKAKANGSVSSLDVINEPDISGIGCDFQTNAVNLGTGQSRFGLPPFITSIFNSVISAENFCLGDFTDFEVDANGIIDSILWDFGDGTTSTQISPSHRYASAGNYVVTVVAVVEGNSTTNTKNITIVEPPIATDITVTQCSLTTAETGIIFPLDDVANQLINGNPSLSVTFFDTFGTALLATPSIGNLVTNTANPQKIFARVTNNSGCFDVSEITLVVNAMNEPTTLFQKCDDNLADGLTAFDLSEITLPTTGNTTYYSSLENAQLQQFPLNQSFTNTIPDQIIFGRINNGIDCDGIYPVQLQVLELPVIPASDQKFICTNIANDVVTLTSGIPAGSTSNYTYLWSTLETTSSISVRQAGNYSVTVTNADNCSSTRTFEVTASNAAIIEKILVTDLSDNNTVTVTLASLSLGDYGYSLDAPNGPFQPSNYFENVSAGFHTVYVKDINGCGISDKTFSVVSVPKFFTPNQDGYNDTWNIIGVNALYYKNSKIYIFDRFGKLLADVDPKGPGWDGTFNGRHLPSTDYWYVVQLDDGRVVKGHFSLIR